MKELLCFGAAVFFCLTASPTSANAEDKKPAATAAEKKAPAPAKKSTTPKPKVTPKKAASAGSAVTISDLQLAEKLKKGKPVASATSFGKDTSVYVWFKASAASDVKLRWTINGKSFTGQPFTVKPGKGNWRYQPLIRSGDWMVEVLGTDDKALQSLAFKVSETEADAPSTPAAEPKPE